MSSTPVIGVDCVRLACLAAEPLAPAQAEIEQAGEASGARRSPISSTGSARGWARGAVTRRELVDAHMPEFSVAGLPAWRRAAGARGRLALSSRRRRAPRAGAALRLFERPEPIEAIAETPDGPPLRFKWRRVLHDIAAIEGPRADRRRMVAQPARSTRDYFRAEDTDGRRFWLYREGLLGRETTRAKWFLHGVFA